MKPIWYYALIIVILGLLFFTSFKLLAAVSVVKCILGGVLLFISGLATLAILIREILYYSNK